MDLLSARTAPRLWRWRWSLVIAALLAALAALSLGLGVPSSARADGDPGSDVLVDQNLFAPADLNLSVAAQERLATLLNTAAAHGTPVRVAIIASQYDLGAITSLWEKPQVYARYLGIELSLAYSGRLLIVMPGGFGLNWPGHDVAPGLDALARVKITSGSGGLLAATESAVHVLMAQGTGAAASRPAATGGHTIGPRPAPVGLVGTSGSSALSGVSGSSAGSGSGQSTDTAVTLVAVIVIVLAALGAGAWFIVSRRGLGASAGSGAGSGSGAGAGASAAWPATAWQRALAVGQTVAIGSHRNWRSLAPRLAILAAGAVAISLVLLNIGGSPSTSSASTFSPFLDPGTPLRGFAPDFTLSDQFGRPISLHSFRGKVVILAFNDSECTTVCPLTSQAMLDAEAMLGPAASRVQLLGIDANPASISVEDVWQYSELHGMLHAWHFLTGTLPQLKRVWKEYAVAAAIEHGEVTHTPALFVIGPTGKEERVYLTQMSYAAVGQLGKLLAQEASNLLPGHPRVRSSLSYAPIPAVAPTASVSIPAADGGRVRLGPGHGAHLYLFFATWDQEITGLAGHMTRLDTYASQAARSGVPALTAIDEGSVEPSASAVSSFLSGLGHPLSYRVGIDWTGRVADGYEVQGEPWFVLVSGSGQILWYSQVSTAGWPSRLTLDREVRAALARAPRLHLTLAEIHSQLAGSPAPLAALHDQADEVLGNESALAARVRALRGYPIVINAWASWCTPCRSEFELFASASAYFGRNVAFLGADTDDSASDARGFLHQHPVSYPSYEATTSDLRSLAVVEGLPTTIYVSPSGKVVYVHTGQYDSLGTLESDITADEHSG